MNKFFKKFLEINKSLIQDHKNNNKFFILDRGKGHYISALHNSILGAAVNKKLKINPVIVTDLSQNDDVIKIYKSFGYSIFEIGFRYKYVLLNLLNLLSSFWLSIKAIFFIKKFSYYYFINKFNVNNIFIGDLIYDSYIRYGMRFSNPKVDLYFINILFISIYRTKNLIDYFKKYKPKLIIIGTQSYANNHGISLKICIKNKIKVLEPYFDDYQKEYRLRKYNKKNLEHGYQNMFNDDFKKNVLENKKIKEKTLDIFLKKRKTGSIKTSYTGFRDLIYSSKSNEKWNRKELLNYFKVKDIDLKKIVLLAPHAFTDAPHCRGTIFAFRDYYQQVTETLNFIDQNFSKGILWIVRPHPTSIIEYGEEGIVKKLINDLDNPLIKLCPNNINTDNILDLIDVVITGRGTIALEAAIKGKNSIIAGGAAYSGLGLAIEANNKNEYFKNILKIEKIKKIKKNKILLAKKTLYYFDTKKIELKESKIMSFKVRSSIKNQEKVFSEKFIKSIKNIGFKNDPLYKDLLNII